MTEKAETDKEAAIRVQKELSRLASSYKLDIETFIDRLMADHKTVQRNVFRLFMACMKERSERWEAGTCDFRNRRTCKVYNMIIEMFDEEMQLPYV